MIAIDPAPFKSCPAKADLGRRELTRFLSRAKAAVGLAGEIPVLLTGDERIRALNREFRHIDKPTDVLSFPAGPAFAGSGVAGDLAISLETAMRQAAERGHALQTEIEILMLHGLLHLAGYDHDADSGQMARRESELRKKMGLPSGLIERGRQPGRRARRPRKTEGRSAGTHKPAARKSATHKSRASRRAPVTSS